MVASVGGDVDLPSPRVRRMVDRIPFLDKELFLMGRFLPVGGTMVDVGAAGGAHTLVAARHVGPRGRVVAIEARPGSAGLLRRWRAVLGLDQVTVLSTALGAEPGSLELRTPIVPTRTHAHRAASDDADGDWVTRLPARVRSVGMTTLDLVVESQGLERLDLLKIDVEGAEPHVVAGGEHTIERFRPVVVIEVEDRHLRGTGHTGDDVVSWFTQRGWTPHVLDDDGLVVVDRVTVEHNDYVLVPGE